LVGLRSNSSVLRRSIGRPVFCPAYELNGRATMSPPSRRSRRPMRRPRCSRSSRGSCKLSRRRSCRSGHHRPRLRSGLRRPRRRGHRKQWGNSGLVEPAVKSYARAPIKT